MNISSQGGTCPKCGANRKPGAKFCGGCGRQFTDAPAAVSENVAAILPTAAKIIQGVSQVGIPGAALPSWHVVVGNQIPIFPALPKMPAIMPKLGLKGPIWALAVTAIMDVGAAMATQNPAAMKTVFIRAGLAAITVVIGLVGRSRPIAGKLMAVFAVILSLVQGGSIFGSLQSLSTMSSLLKVSPNLITQGFAITTAVRLAWTAGRQSLR